LLNQINSISCCSFILDFIFSHNWTRRD